MVRNRNMGAWHPVQLVAGCGVDMGDMAFCVEVLVTVTTRADTRTDRGMEGK